MAAAIAPANVALPTGFEWTRNTMGVPVYGLEVGNPTLVRLIWDTTNNITVLQDMVTTHHVDANGNPLDGPLVPVHPVLAGALIPQPDYPYLVTVMVNDALRARVQAGNLTPPPLHPGIRPPNFGRTPATVNSVAIIDYMSREGAAEYREATRSLYLSLIHI